MKINLLILQIYLVAHGFSICNFLFILEKSNFFLLYFQLGTRRNEALTIFQKVAKSYLALFALRTF